MGFHSIFRTLYQTDSLNYWAARKSRITIMNFSQGGIAYGSEYNTGGVVLTPADATLSHASKLIRDLNVGSVIVESQDGEAIRVLTDRRVPII